MKTLLIILSSLYLCPVAFGQLANSSRQQSVNGSITVPVLQTLQVTPLIQQPLLFQGEDMKAAKIFTSFCKVRVISNIPWQLTVNANAKIQETKQPEHTISPGIFEVKPSSSVIYTSLSDKPVIIYRSTGNNIDNTIYLDLKVTPSYLIHGGSYYPNLQFNLIPQ